MTDNQGPNLPSRAALKAIGAYQSARSGQLSPCRFTPSCSEYAAEAVGLHGFVYGTGLAIWRILRCNPLGSHGLDPVPIKTGVSR
jgi:hypothetical protein